MQFINHVLFQAGITDLDYFKHKNFSLSSLIAQDKVPLSQLKDKAQPGDLLLIYREDNTTFKHVCFVDQHYDNDTMSVVELHLHTVSHETIPLSSSENYYIVGLDQLRARHPY